MKQCNYIIFLLFSCNILFCSDNYMGGEKIASPPLRLSFCSPEDKNISDIKSRIGMRIVSQSYAYEPTINYRYAFLSRTDFQRLFECVEHDYDILSNHELYAFDNFCAFAKELPHYAEYMCSLQTQIKNNKYIRKNTEFVPGFELL